MQNLTLVSIGRDPRMDRVKACVRGKADIQELSPDAFPEGVPAPSGCTPLLFLAAVDELGVGEDFLRTLRRIRAQMPDREKVRRGNIIIRNNGSLSELERRTREVFDELLENLDR